MTVNRLLWIATIISIVAFSFWRYLWDYAFYHIIAIFIFLLSLIIFIQNKRLFIAFFLFSASIGNLLDELFFGNTTTTKNEIIFALTIPLIWYIKKLWNARKIPTK